MRPVPVSCVTVRRRREDTLPARCSVHPRLRLTTCGGSRLCPADRHFVRCCVDAEVSDLDHSILRFAFCGDTAKIGPNPCQQFIHTEWLGEIIVGAATERPPFLL